jgi:hypothetical protein
VGVFADRALQPRWIVEALGKVAACDFAELTLVSTPEIGVRHQFPRSDSVAGNWCLTPISWLTPVYRALDERLFGSASSVPTDVTQLVPAPRRLHLSDPVPQLDVAVALGDILDGDLAGVARCGVWRFSFGEDHHTDEGRAGVREVASQAHVTSSGLRIHLGNGQGDRVACASWARTQPFSVAQNRANVFAKSTDFLARALRDLHDQGWTWIEQGTVPAPAMSPSGSAIPAAEVARIGTRLAQRAVQKFSTIDQWALGFRFTAEENWDSLESFVRLDPPKDRFWADPFPIQVNGRSYIFFEELPFAAGRAHISVVEVFRDGTVSQPVPVVERDYHLSYPFLVEDRGELFMIPESAANHTIEIYRCVDFPFKWKREKALVEGVWSADATVHREGDRWFMFANSAPNYAEIHDELHLYTASSLLGDWKALRRNPVKSDARCSRPAGALFREGDALYRPAQICAPLYGSGIVVNRVTRLDEHGFQEEEARRIVPAEGSGILGVHTMNRAGTLSVTDFFVRRRRFGA